MTVQLEVGMTGIRRDGERVGPMLETASDSQYKETHPLMDTGGLTYRTDGKYNIESDPSCNADIIAAGYPWADLGAKPGDTVRLMWSGVAKQAVGDMEYQVCVLDAPHPGSLYAIVKSADAPKPADRPRAAHKLDLQDGDVVELVGWQDGKTVCIGEVYEKCRYNLLNIADPENSWVYPSLEYKGHRPLFRVISRAADAKPEVIVVHSGDKNAFGRTRVASDTHRFTLTFPYGSDVGTVTREKL